MELVKLGSHTLHVNARAPEYNSRVGTGKSPAFAAATQLVDKAEGPKGFVDTVAAREDLLKDGDALNKVLLAAGVIKPPKAKPTTRAPKPAPSSGD